MLCLVLLLLYHHHFILFSSSFNILAGGIFSDLVSSSHILSFSFSSRHQHKRVLLTVVIQFRILPRVPVHFVNSSPSKPSSLSCARHHEKVKLDSSSTIRSPPSFLTLSSAFPPRGRLISFPFQFRAILNIAKKNLKLLFLVRLADHSNSKVEDKSHQKVSYRFEHGYSSCSLYMHVTMPFPVNDVFDILFLGQSIPSLSKVKLDIAMAHAQFGFGDSA